MPVVSGLATGGLRYAEQVGAEAVQVFVGNPRGWALSPGLPREDRTLRGHVERTRLPVFVHAPYLVNVGSPDRETRRRSVAALRHALRRGYEIGARGVVVHTGSAVLPDRYRLAMRQVRDSLLPLLDGIPDDGPDLLLEPMAGQGQMLCARVQDLGPYLEVLDRHPRVGVCLDTCHAFAAGHDLTAPGGVRAVLETLEDWVGAGRLKLVHANDSGDVCGSCRDRHTNIGRGHIGERPFAELFGHPVTEGVPVIVETPGKAGPHRRDIELLKCLRR
ncbi:MAG: deoxyribonuclease IV [Streptosporangiales bacterium]|nr:deoxyribonuclease IV [Streptosporangiales bacterium]